MSNYSGSRATRSKHFKFTPTEKQKQTAKHRMLCTLNKHDGQTPVRSFGDAVDFFCKEVYNRGGELGTYEHKQFKATIKTCLNELLEERLMTLDPEQGLIILSTPVKTSRRTHRQKYPKGLQVKVA